MPTQRKERTLGQAQPQAGGKPDLHDCVYTANEGGASELRHLLSFTVVRAETTVQFNNLTITTSSSGVAKCTMVRYSA